MKNLSILLVFIFSPILLSASYLSDGMYLSHHSNKKVRIKARTHYVKAKHLTCGDWVRFNRVTRGLFSDRRGNTIRLVNNEIFEFRSRSNHRRLRFIRHNLGDRIEHSVYSSLGADHRCNRHCNHAEQYHACTSSCADNCRYAPGYSDYEGSYDDPYTRPSVSLEGVWQSYSTNKDVIIEMTPEGLRAKFLGQGYDWVYYRQDAYDRNEYVDGKGNRYERRSATELVWYPYGGGSAIKLRK